jgi:hypothetical protein
MEITPADLYAKIGMLTIEIDLLKQQIMTLQAKAAETEDKPE